MAVMIPTSRERTVRADPMPAARQNIDTPADAFGGNIGRALEGAGKTMTAVGNLWDSRAQEMQKEQNALRVMELDNQAQREMMDFFYDPNTGELNNQGRNALGVVDNTKKKMEEVRQKYLGMQDSPDVKTMMTEKLTRLENASLDMSQRHLMENFQKYKTGVVVDRQAVNNEAAAMAWNDDKEFEARVKANKNLMIDQAKADGSYSETPEGIKILQSKAKAVESGMIATRITAALQTGNPKDVLAAKNFYESKRASNSVDFATSLKIENMLNQAVPQAAAQVAFTAGKGLVQADDAAGFVVDNLEGGAKIVQEPNGGFAKYGINSKAHPDVDVKNLTREGAMEILKKEYWERYKIDDVSPSMRLLAFDTAVNHRTEFVKKALEAIKNGATTDEVLNMRLQEYKRLAKEDPAKYGASYEGWKGRLAAVQERLGAGWDATTAQAEADKLEGKIKGAGGQFMTLYTNSVKQAEAQKKAYKDGLTDQIQKTVTQAKGDISAVPAPVRAEAVAQGIDITKFASMVDPVENAHVKSVLDAMSSDDFFSVDLNSPELASRLTYDQKLEYRKKQQELSKPENKFMQDMVDSVANYYFKSASSSNAKDTKENKAAIADMKNYIRFNVETLREKGNVTRADVNKIASEYLAVKKLGNADKVYQIPERERKVIEQSLIEGGTTPSEEAVLAVYKRMRQNNGGADTPFLTRMLSLFD